MNARSRSPSTSGPRAVRVATTALLGICVAAAAAAGSNSDSCVWGPIKDVQAGKVLLDNWATPMRLERFKRWGVGIDGSSARVILEFEHGVLTLTWQLGKDCEPTAITIESSVDYEGPRPDEAAVRRLVADLQTVTTAQRLAEVHSSPISLAMPTASWMTLIVVGAVSALCAVLALVLRFWRVPRMPLGNVRVATLVWWLGVIDIVALLPYQSPLSGPYNNWLHANSVVLLGVLPLIAFLWLTVSGFFGYGSPERSDWIALVPFLVGFVASEAFTLHSIEEIELHFYNGFLPDKNSIVHPLFQMFIGQFATDPYAFMTHVNGLMGALATLPLFLFVRHRTGSRLAGFVTAFYFALQPVVMRFAPTDSPYALIFLTWFSGLALLSTREIGARQLFAGATLLAIAATCRMEGPLYLVASVLLLDLRTLIRSLREHQLAAALAAGSVGALVGVHWWYCMPLHSTGSVVTLNPRLLPMDYLSWDTFRESLFGPVRSDPLFRVLIGFGAVAGVVNRRLRIGLGAALGSLVVVIPMTQSSDSGILTLHRLVPVCGLQAITAGVGAFWITSLILHRLRNNWITVAPAVIAALYIFVVHRGELGVRYAFNEEFDILRQQLAPNGAPNPQCSLLSFPSRMDSGLHWAGQVVPGMRVLNCWDDDCLKEARRGGCMYYFRPVTCYLRRAAVSAVCQARGITADGDHLPCIEYECAELEKALEFSVVEERTVYPHRVWGVGEMATRFPAEARIGLYRVLGTR
jgi:hypothetical protein